MSELLYQYMAMAIITIVLLALCLLAFSVFIDTIKCIFKILKFIWRKLMLNAELKKSVLEGGETGLCITTADGKEIYTAQMKPEFQYKHNDALVLQNDSDKKHYIVLDKARYEDMIQAEDKLAALENAGVDNWSGYGEAMSELEEEE